MKKVLKKIILVIVLIIIIFLVKFIYNFSIINKIGKKIVDTYSLNNIYYEYRNTGKNTESSIRKRLNKKIYYESIVGEGEGATKQIYYSDNENDVYYYAPENEKILIPERKVILYWQMDTQMAKTRAEVYAYQNYLGNGIFASKAYNLKSIKSKIIDNIECYEITMKYDNYLEKTYFNKETLLPIKVIKENTKNNNILEWEIIIKEDVVTEIDVAIPEDYTVMEYGEYLEYIRQKNVDFDETN